MAGGKPSFRVEVQGAAGKPLYQVFGEADRSLSEALNDEISPGVIDRAELLHTPSLQKYCDLRKDPPFMERARTLTHWATRWNFFGDFFGGEAKQRESDQGAQELLKSIGSPNLLENLSEESIAELRALSREIEKEGSDPFIQALGHWMIDSLERYSQQYIEPPSIWSADSKGTRRSFELCPAGKVVYTYAPVIPTDEEMQPPPGLERPVRYWDLVYSSTYDYKLEDIKQARTACREEGKSDKACDQMKLKLQIVFGGEFSKKGPPPPFTNPYDLSETEFYDPDKSDITNLLNLEIVKSDVVATVRRAAREQEEVEGTKHELMQYKEGRKTLIDAALDLVGKRMPHAEAIFEEAGVDPRLWVIVLIESEGKSSAVSKDKRTGAPIAFGPYQITTETAGHFQMEIDSVRGIDERRNFYFSTMVAAEHLRDNKEQLLGRAYVKGRYVKSRREFIPGLNFDERLAMWASTSGYHAGIPALKRALKRSLQELQFERRKNKSKEPITADEVFATLITGGLLVGSYRGDSKDYPPQLWPAMKAAYGFTARERGENPDLRKQVPDLVVVNLDLINRPIPFDQLLGQVSTTNFQHHNDQYSNSWYERPTDSSLTGKARFIVLAGEEGRLSEWLIRNRYVSKAGIHLKKLGLPSKVAVLERSLTSSVEIPIPEPPRPVAKKEVAGK